MNGKYLLDTSVIVEIFQGNRKVLHSLSSAAEVFVPVVAIGELLYGATKSSRKKENIQQVKSFAQANVVLPCDIETAEWYALVKNTLRVKGRPIPENDIWIAALAKQYGLTVATRDTHFQEIDGLPVVFW